MRKSIALLLLLLPMPAFAQSSWVNGLTFQGQEITVDLPEKYQIRNIGSKIDQSGMCVFTSIEMAAEWHGLDDMKGWRDWCANNYPGGGYPEKVDALLNAWWKHKNIVPIPYIQYEGTNPQTILDLCDKTNRCACITYGQSPRYIGNRNPQGRIAHMVCLVGFKGNAIVLDNNFIGEKNLEWMSAAELIRRNMLTDNKAWVFVWKTPGRSTHPERKPMKRTILCMLSALLCLASSALMDAQAQSMKCGPSGCTIIPDTYHWLNDSTQSHLYRNNKQIGSYDHSTHIYRPLIDYTQGIWGAQQHPPLEPPHQEQPHWQLSGVHADKIAAARLTYCGKEVAHHVAYAALAGEGNGLEDDTDKLWLIVIGKDKTRRKAILKDLEASPNLAEFRKRLNTWDMPPDSFHAVDRDTGKPLYECKKDLAVYLMDAKGKVFWRQDGYQGPDDFKAIRKADPNYDPKNDPSPEKPIKAPDNPTLANTIVIACAIIFALAWLTLITQTTRS